MCLCYYEGLLFVVVGDLCLLFCVDWLIGLVLGFGWVWVVWFKCFVLDFCFVVLFVLVCGVVGLGWVGCFV